MEFLDPVQINAMMQRPRKASHPLTFLELIMRFPRPNKGKMFDLASAPQHQLNEQVRRGSIHCEPSGEFQREQFHAVLRLADQRRVIVGQDAHPARFTLEELGAFVRDGCGWHTTIGNGEY